MRLHVASLGGRHVSDCRVTGEAEAISSCRISAADRGPLRVPGTAEGSAACCLPYSASKAARPPSTGSEEDDEPSAVGTGSIECVPHEVKFEPSSNVVGFVALSGTTPWPGSTSGQNMPSVWPAASKSLESITTTTPCCSAYSSAARWKELNPSAP